MPRTVIAGLNGLFESRAPAPSSPAPDPTHHRPTAPAAPLASVDESVSDILHGHVTARIVFEM